MADNQEGYKTAKVLGPNKHLVMNSDGSYTVADGAPTNTFKNVPLSTGYKQDDFKEDAITQGLYGQGQTTQPQFVTGQPQQTSIQAAPVQVNVAPAAPANTVVEAVVSTAETVGNAIASDLTNTVKDGVAMVNNAHDMVNMFIPGNNS